MNFRIRALEEQLQYVDSSKSDHYRVKIEYELGQIEALSVQLGMNFRTSKKKRGRRYIDEFIPSDTELMRVMFADLDEAETAEFVQRFYSAAVHANANSFAIGTVVSTSSSREGASTAALTLEVGEAARYLQTMTYAFALGYEAICSYFGHANSPSVRKAWYAMSVLSQIAVSGT
ncbi:hypothetical protein B2J88_32150 [Rhodococcus sp. SRB_17]|nr:hypothetical protein [Rhodococcus sp. SRB_17]